MHFHVYIHCVMKVHIPVDDSVTDSDAFAEKKGKKTVKPDYDID